NQREHQDGQRSDRHERFAEPASHGAPLLWGQSDRIDLAIAVPHNRAAWRHLPIGGLALKMWAFSGGSAVAQCAPVPFRHSLSHTKFARGVTNVPPPARRGAAELPQSACRGTCAKRTHVWQVAHAWSGAFVVRG